MVHQTVTALRGDCAVWETYPTEEDDVPFAQICPHPSSDLLDRPGTSVWCKVSLQVRKESPSLQALQFTVSFLACRTT